MILDKIGIDFIANEEGGFILHPYKDSRGIPTISAGVTYYEDGTNVSIDDLNISQERAEELFSNTLKIFQESVSNDLKSILNQNQFNALVSITYNIGIGGFKESTLLKLVNVNPNDPNITSAFEMWKKSGNDEFALLPRRKREAKLYFS